MLYEVITILTGYLYIAVTRMLSLLTLEKKRKHADFSVIERVLSYISDNYQNQISLFYIADQLDISPFYISRVFSSYRITSYNVCYTKLLRNIFKKNSFPKP